MKLLSKKSAQGKRDDARYDLVRGVFFLTLLVQLLCVRWSPPTALDEALFQAAGGFWRTGIPSIAETPEAAILSAQIVSARQVDEESSLGFLWQDPEGLSVALPSAPAGMVLALVPAHVVGSSLHRLMPSVEADHRARTGGRSSEFFAHLLAALLGPLAGAIACAALASGALALGASRPMAALAGVSVGLGSVLGTSSSWSDPALLSAASLSYAWATLLHLADRVSAGRTVGGVRYWAVGCALALTLLLDMRAWPFVLLVLAFGEAGLRRARGCRVPFGQISALLAIMGPSLLIIAWELLGSDPLALISQRHFQGAGTLSLMDAPLADWLGASAAAWAFAPCLLFAFLGAGRLMLGADRLVGVLALIALGISAPALLGHNAHGPVVLIPLLVFVGPVIGVGLGYCAGLRLGHLPLGPIMVAGLTLMGVVTQMGGGLVDSRLLEELDDLRLSGNSELVQGIGPRSGTRWRILRRQFAVDDSRFPVAEVYSLGESEVSGETLTVAGDPGRLWDHLAMNRLGDDLDLPLLPTLVTLILVALAGLTSLAARRGLDPSRWP